MDKKVGILIGSASDAIETRVTWMKEGKSESLERGYVMELILALLEAHAAGVAGYHS
jgi:hypothetical protein